MSELSRATSDKSKKYASVDFKSKIKLATKKDEDVKINDAFTTFQYTKEASTESDDVETVFIFPRNWPEWSDYEMNTETWSNEDIEDKQKSNSADFYHDPEGVLLPHSQMRILDIWKRPIDAFQNPCILYDSTVKSIDIISPNKHLLNSRCMRWVISSIAMVQKLAEDTPFQNEGENPQYIPNGGIPWRPWHHIYSLCKAGNIPHKPLINPSGKYIIRLYYLGCWRKIVVDDKLPFDSKGKMLLPASDINGELWPMLLSKALLKIASHTWNKIEDPSGFHPITSLTGWMCEEFTNLEFDNFELWKLINGILEEEEEEVVEPPKVETPPPEVSKKGKKKTEKLPKGAKDKTEVPEVVKKPPKPTEILAVLSYWSEKYDESEVVQQIFPMKENPQPVINHSAIERLKRMNFPVLFQGYKEKLKRISENQMKNAYPWRKKQHRSEFEKQNCVPECYLKAYSHFFGMIEDIPPVPEAEENEPPPEEVGEIDSNKKGQKGKKDKKEKKEKGKKEKKNNNSSENIKSGKGSSPGKTPVIEKLMMDTGKWLSFNSLVNLLEGIILIHKPALFTSHIQKPDFSRLLSPKISSTPENFDDIDEESELCSEFAVEEKSYICLDSAEEINFIIGLFMLPTPTKLDENYSTAFDLMLNACEGKDEEYFNHNSSHFMCDTHISYRRKNKTKNQPLNTSDKYLEQWVEYNNDLVYELEGDNEQYALNDHLFLDKDALVVEISVDEDTDDSEDIEWECDEYEMKLFKVGEMTKKRIEDVHFKSFDVQRRATGSLHPASPRPSFLEKKSMLDGLTKVEPQINTYMLSNQLQSSKVQNFKTLEDIETFYGHPTVSYQPQSLRTSTYLGIEIFRWDESNIGHPEMQFHVINGKTIHFALPPGRHIFKLIIRSASFYSLHLLSNVGIFHSISKSELLTVMKEDCARLTYFEKEVHQNFENLVFSLRNDGVSKAIRDLHNSYLPLCYGGLQNDEKELIHKAFKECIRKIVLENISPLDQDDVFWALKIVFLDAKFKKDDFQPKVATDDNRNASISQRKESRLERRMTQIQKSMLNEMPILRNIYGLSQDLENEIQVYEWKGLTLEINRDSWIPLVRYVFGWKSEEEVISSIIITCPLNHWIMKIIDNDSGQEIQRINNCCIPYPYKKNEKGYTLFAYGLDGLQWWSTVPWKVNQIMPKSSPPLQICQRGVMSSDIEKIPMLRADALSGYYIPNLQKRICSFSMKVKEFCQISLHFNTSNKDVEFKFLLIDEKMEKIINEEREEFLVIPSIFLNGPVENEEYKVYTGKVTLLNTWPLSDYQKKFSENQWIKDVAHFQVSAESTAVLPRSAGGKSGAKSTATSKANRQSLMESKLKPFVEPVLSLESYPATWRLEVLLNSPQEVILEEMKQKGHLQNMKKEWQELDPDILQKNSELYSRCQSNSFKECLEYSKKWPTKFKSDLPFFEEFYEKESEDEDTSEIKPRASLLRERQKSMGQRKSVKSKKKKKETEVMRDDNNTMSSVTTNATLIENGYSTDEGEDGLESSSESSDNQTPLESPPENLIGHFCDISTQDIVGFHEMLDDNKNAINVNFINKGLEYANDLKGKENEIEPKRRSTELSLYDEVYNNKGELDSMKEQPTNKNDSLTNGAGGNAENVLQRPSTLSGISKLSLNAEQMTEDSSEVETLFQMDGNMEEEGQVDYYKSYYIDNSDTISTSSEESCDSSHSKKKVMTINDWVKIQSKMVNKQERFKKKLFKIFTEVESLVRAPFEGHLEKWNMYLANAWRSSDEAFNDTEKSLYAYRREKKKLEIIRKEKIKEDIKIIYMIKGGPAKKGKKGKEEKLKTAKEKGDKSKKGSINNDEEEGETEGDKRNAKMGKKTKKAK